MSTRSIVHEEAFDVESAALFDALLRPSAIRVWWSASHAIVLPSVGGTWAATWGDDEDAPDYVTIARIAELEPGRRLVLTDYRYHSKDGPLPFEAEFTTSFEVAARKSGATLRIEQAGFPASENADDFYAGCVEGWRRTFAGLQEYLASDPRS